MIVGKKRASLSMKFRMANLGGTTGNAPVPEWTGFLFIGGLYA